MMNVNRFPVLYDIAIMGKKPEIALVQAITKYFRKYLPKPGEILEQEVINDDKNDKIFSIWLQGEENAPDIIKSCFRSIRKHCKQELIVLDEKTLFDYIKLPEEILKKYRQGIIKAAHFADICRVELLYRYGGYWLDATAFVTQPVPQYIVNSDFFMFLVNPDWDVGYSFVQNCFISARKGTYLLAAWRAMIFNYWIHENRDFDYWMHGILFKILVMYDNNSKEYFTKMPRTLQDGIYALWDKYKDKPFDETLFKKIIKDAFFQKTTYKGLDNIIPSSFADVIIKMK